MTSTHTPGPWSYGGLIGKSPGAIVANGGGVQVATAKVVPLMYGQQITSEEANANARLIAAAPDLLDALRAMLAQANPFGSLEIGGGGLPHTVENLTPEAWSRRADDAQSKARAAIAKATGEAA